MVSQAMWGAGPEQGGVQWCSVSAELPAPCGRVSHDRILAVGLAPTAEGGEPGYPGDKGLQARCTAELFTGTAFCVFLSASASMWAMSIIRETTVVSRIKLVEFPLH